MNEHATVAEYFRVGVELGLISADEPRSWANDLVRDLEHPPGEVIEVSWSTSNERLVQALREVPGERDRRQVGSWLLGLLFVHLQQSADPEAIAQKAKQVAYATELEDDVQFELLRLEDAFSLAGMGYAGSVESCGRELEIALAKHAPLNAET